MKKRPVRFFALAAAVISMPALAHSGPHDGALMAIVIHLLDQPDHLALVVIALACCVIGLSLVPDTTALRSVDDPR